MTPINLAWAFLACVLLFTCVLAIGSLTVAGAPVSLGFIR